MQAEEGEVLTDDVPDPYVFSAHTASGQIALYMARPRTGSLALGVQDGFRDARKPCPKLTDTCSS
jgi:hypothetical protein